MCMSASLKVFKVVFIFKIIYVFGLIIDINTSLHEKRNKTGNNILYLYLWSTTPTQVPPAPIGHNLLLCLCSRLVISTSCSKGTKAQTLIYDKNRISFTDRAKNTLYFVLDKYTFRKSDNPKS